MWRYYALVWRSGAGGWTRPATTLSRAASIGAAAGLAAPIVAAMFRPWRPTNPERWPRTLNPNGPRPLGGGVAALGASGGPMARPTSRGATRHAPGAHHRPRRPAVARGPPDAPDTPQAPTIAPDAPPPQITPHPGPERSPRTPQAPTRATLAHPHPQPRPTSTTSTAPRPHQRGPEHPAGARNPVVGDCQKLIGPTGDERWFGQRGLWVPETLSWLVGPLFGIR